MTEPADVLRSFLGFSKWAIVLPYNTPEGEQWGWIGTGVMSQEGVTGFLTKATAHQDARGKGFEVEDWTGEEGL